MAPSARGTVATIEQFLSTVGMDKAAEAHTEPGSKGGETSHPVKDVDDRTETATEGERSAENERDVKEDQGEAGVDSTPEAKAASLMNNVARLARPTKRAGDGPASSPGSAADDQVQIGTNKQPTGDDPSVETASVKGGKNDPGSAHPARTDNDALEGGKYAYDVNTPWEKTAAMLTDVGNELCALIHVIQQGEPAAVKRAADAAPAQQAFDPALARQAGWELAGLQDGTLDKRAADAMVEATIAEIIKVASADGDRTVEFLDAYTKAAAGENDPGDPTQPPAGDGGGDPAAMMGGAGQQGGMDPTMGGAPPGGPPGAPGGDGDGDEGGAGGEMISVDQVAQLLASLGIPPEKLEAAMAGAQGGPPPDGGAPDAGGGAPPAPAGAAGGAPGAPGMEVAASDRTKKAAQKTAAAARQRIVEIIQRSRRAS